jgi:hypothetical protein
LRAFLGSNIHLGLFSGLSLLFLAFYFLLSEDLGERRLPLDIVELLFECDN